jgi:anaerobic magnesium-protoporphyrin IX monomethyl ester cyclase
MKIVLVRYHDRSNINTRLPASLNTVQGVLPPLGISYIAAVLENEGYDVGVIDAVALGLTADEFRATLARGSPDVVCVTCMTSSIHGSLEAARIARGLGATTVLGGTHLSIYPVETLSYDCVDYGILGEGEYATLELVRALEAGGPVAGIKGLAYKTGDGVAVNGPALVEDLDPLPFPARHLLPMDRYSSIIGLHPVTTMISSRGCPYRCGFCFKGPSDRKHRTRGPKNVVDEMETVVRDYGIREIMFYDDVIALRRKSIVGICEEIIARGLDVKWESPARVDNVDLELLRLMKRAGCIRLRYGVESGDPEILESMNKGIDLAGVKRAFEWTRRVGIQTFAYFIIGYIGETSASIRRTLQFSRELDPDLVMFTLATPYPGTELYRQAQLQGYIKGDYWREFTLGRASDRLPYLAEDAERWMRKAYLGFYLRPSYIIKRLLGIRSWDDVRKHASALRGLLGFRMIR